MNIIFLIVLMLFIGGGIKGFRHGMVEELNKAVALILALAAIAMFVVAAKSYMEHETLRTILGIVCMTIAILVYKIVDFILSSLKIISLIPVIRGVNKLLGFGVGVAESVILIWAVFIVIVAFEFGGASRYILENIKENTLLTFLFSNNYLANLVADIMPII
ncbi:MAG: hypothetical protein HFI94_05720 [Lachnospiraceae bacterium]|jgi:uncharacterized membrane protein required for colicin V production|nr:hypothetical protein [Lachnospiraceae bacterium]